MSDLLDNIQNNPWWEIVEPGVLALRLTKFVIRWAGYGSFILEWDGHALGAWGALDAASRAALAHGEQLQLMGIEP